MTREEALKMLPSSFVNTAGITAADGPATVVRKLDAAFHAVTFKGASAAVAGPVIDQQTQEVLMRQAGIWIEYSTLFEDDLPERPLEAVHAEKHQLDRYTQLVAEHAAAHQAMALVDELRPNAERYDYLRNRDLNAIHRGGVFAGMTPDNVVLNGDTLDAAIDTAIAAQAAAKEGGTA